MNPASCCQASTASFSEQQACKSRTLGRFRAHSVDLLLRNARNVLSGAAQCYPGAHGPERIFVRFTRWGACPTENKACMRKYSIERGNIRHCNAIRRLWHAQISNLNSLWGSICCMKVACRCSSYEEWSTGCRDEEEEAAGKGTWASDATCPRDDAWVGSTQEHTPVPEQLGTPIMDPLREKSPCSSAARDLSSGTIAQDCISSIPLPPISPNVWNIFSTFLFSPNRLEKSEKKNSLTIIDLAERDTSPFLGFRLFLFCWK